MKVLGKVGHGYFCNVKSIINEDLKEKYAFKELKKEHYHNQDYRYRFNREIHLLKKLQGCENIIELLDEGHNEDKESLWYLMPLAEFNLFNYVKKYNGSLGDEERYELAKQVINAIKFAHKKGIIHRDLSPSNVLIFKNNGKIVVKISDFGLGKDSESLSHYSASHVNGYGQYLYISPEQKEKLKDATFRSDIYSLGKVIYFIFTGKDPEKFKPFDLLSLVEKATNELPEDRHEDIDSFEDHFSALKEFKLNSKLSIENLTLSEILELKDDYSWLEIHEILIQGNYSEHVFQDYIEPVLKLFSDTDKLIGYYSEVKSSISGFVKKFSERLNDCYKTTGWPFRKLDDFGSFLINIIKIVDDDEVRLICFKQLWYIAYESDQWAVQTKVKEVFNEKFISPNISTQLGEYIIQSEIDVNLKLFSGLILPMKVKQAIHLSKENAQKSKTKDIDW
ncbi:serine/threonine protein kinase [Belliella sp. DSM 111904]|uniref:Serine/threonine protein kinase n=1 Tax=Belliella filtrata TaxID=2923435 RepID=A0ABS9V184_9BACT|nr:serine/threonine-protein kinase [Belliella filtrata]MCH7410176.1 serine/threonine protein kinase [Belliella filtrata]